MDEVVVHSAALEGNLLGDTADRPVSIYLPAAYDEDAASRFPVLYLLHGWTSTQAEWFDYGPMGLVNLPGMADELIAQGAMAPFIIVMPDATTRYGGSFFTNSPATGNWEDFVAVDLIGYVDAHYRTVPAPESRAVAGRGAGGGYGALRLAMTHPDLFRVVYAMAPYPTAFVPPDAEHAMIDEGSVIEALSAIGSDEVGVKAAFVFAVAAAFTPDPSRPPHYVELPFEGETGSLRTVNAVWDRWQANAATSLAATIGESLANFQLVGIDAGAWDAVIVEGVRTLDAQLQTMGIAHTYDEFPGVRYTHFVDRLRSTVLPSIGNALVGAPD